jgi:hypothetical protein
MRWMNLPTPIWVYNLSGILAVPFFHPRSDEDKQYCAGVYLKYNVRVSLH